MSLVFITDIKNSNLMNTLIEGLNQQKCEESFLLHIDFQ